MRLRCTKYVNYSLDSSDLSDESNSSSDESSSLENSSIILTRSRVKNDVKNNNTLSEMKVYGNVLKSDENIVKKEKNELDECEESPDLKEFNISLVDCFTQKNILNDIAIMHNIPLVFRIKRNKSIRRMKRKFDEDDNQNILFHSQGSRMECHNEDSQCSSTESAHEIKKYISLEYGREADSILTSFNNDYLLDKNHTIYSQPKISSERRTDSKDSILHLKMDNNTPKSNYEAGCNDSGFVENEFMTPQIPLIEQQEWVINTKEERLFSKYMLKKKRRASVERIDDNTVKIPKLNESDQFELSEMLPEDINSIDDNAWNLILGKTPPSVENEHNNTMTLTYGFLDPNIEEPFINSVSQSNTDIPKQDQKENKNCITQDKQLNVTPNEETEVDDDDDDYISLDLNGEKLSLSDIDSEHEMNDQTIDKYHEENKRECDKMFNNVPEDTSASREIAPYSSKLFYPMRDSRLPVAPQTYLNFRNYFPKYCFRMIRFGNCHNDDCRYKHQFLPVFKWYLKNEQKLFQIIDEFKDYKLFLKKCFYYPLLNDLYLIRDIVYVLKILKKLFEIDVINSFDASTGIKSLQNEGCTINILVENLLPIVDNRDYLFVNWFAKILRRRHIQINDYWSTLRSLLLKIEKFDLEVVEDILQECRIVEKNVEDVNKNIVQRLDNNTLSRINGDLLSCFKTSLESRRSVKKNARIIQIDMIRSPNSSPTDQCRSDEDEHLKLEGTVCETRSQSQADTNPRSGSQNQTDTNPRYKLHPIDNLSKPRFKWSKGIREHYENVRKLEEALKHDDFDYVMTILNRVQNDEQSPFTKETYKILCNLIEHSPYKLTKIATSAVQTGATATFYEILTDITVLILAKLAKEKFWVLAYRMMKDLRIILESQIQLYKLNAAIVLLLAEIYLKNKKAIDAFALLKRTNIIYSNQYRWKVQSDKDDSSTRVEIIKLLLNTFCETHPHHGLALFDLIATDQSNNFIPIDLSSVVNKLVLSIVSMKDTDMIIDVTKLIKYHGFRLNSITLSTLLTTLFHVDINLAKQMYRVAAGLGMYSTPQFHPVTYLIMNTNWSKEEMHLAILNLLETFSGNIGHAVDHVSSKACSIHLVFENVPTDRRLFRNKISNEENKILTDKIKEMKKVIRKLLQEELHPPISFMHTASGRTHRLSGKNVLTHIKCNYFNS